MDFKPYNPLEKENLSASVVEALLRRDPYPMVDIPPFSGSGIYAIYYTGDHELYTTIAGKNTNGRFEQPIYVGAAHQGGRRKGEVASDPMAGKALSRRLREHRQSIDAAQNLDIKDFYFRTLVVEDLWISTSERLIINMFKPAWNVFVEGFGNHDPGAGRYKGACSLWDVIHPGRLWAALCARRDETVEEITAYMIKSLGAA